MKFEANTRYDNFQYALHAGLTLATAGIAVVFSGFSVPVLIAGSGIALLTYGLQKVLLRQVSKNTKRVENLPRNAQYLHGYVAELGKKAGLKKTPEIIDLFYDAGTEVGDESRPGIKGSLHISGRKTTRPIRSPQIEIRPQTRFGQDTSRSGLKVLGRVKSSENEDSLKNGIRQTIRDLRNQTKRFLNAAAIDFGHRLGVSYTKRLIDSLDTPEEKAVTGHEILHIAAKHARRRLPLALLNVFSNTVAGLTVLGIAVSSPPAAIAFLAGIVVSLGIKSLVRRYYGIPSGDSWKEARDRAAKEQELASKNVKFQYLMKVVPKVATYATYLWSGQYGLLVSSLTAQGIRQSNTLVQASLSRRQEFQADRGGSELSEKPEAMASALGKLLKENAQIEPERFAKVDHRQGTLLERTLKLPLTLYKSHPNVARRQTAIRRHFGLQAAHL